MSRNGSGTYSLPVAPFTPGTTISSSDVNSDLSDIATAITGSIAADGQTAITGQLKGALGSAPTYSISGDLNTGFGSASADTAFIQCGGANVVSCTSTTATILALAVTNNATITGTLTVTSTSTFNNTSTFNASLTLATAAINETSTTLASAGTVNIGAAAANYIFISGVTTITAFDTVASGIERTLEFQGILTLTYNAATLILPGSASITTAAGDTAIFRSEGTGNWRCISYVRRAAVPLIGIAPTVQKFTSGTAQTYTAATSVLRQRVRMVGGGGGGGAQATNPGTNGTSSSFQVNGAGTAWTAVFGNGGTQASTSVGGVGGTGGTDGSTGTLIVRFDGQRGGSIATTQNSFPGGIGGSSVFGGAGTPALNAAGGAAKANTGSGGAGAGNTVTNGGSGGGAAEYVEFWVTGMTTATYTVGAKGTGGSAGALAGGDGAAGIIIIEEFYW